MIIQIQLHPLPQLLPHPESQPQPEPEPPKRPPPPKMLPIPPPSPQIQERIKIQISILHPQLSFPLDVVPHPHPQFVAVKSLILFPPGKINYIILICGVACFVYVFCVDFLTQYRYNVYREFFDSTK